MAPIMGEWERKVATLLLVGLSLTGVALWVATTPTGPVAFYVVIMAVAFGALLGKPLLAWVLKSRTLLHGKRVTASEIAGLVLEGALQSAKTVDETLAEIGAFERHPGVRHSRTYNAELMLLATAPMDYMLADLPRNWAPQVRKTMQELLLEALDRGEPDGHRATRSQCQQRIAHRFAQYSAAVRTGDLTGLGEVAAGAIGLQGDVDAEGFLVSTFTGTLNLWLDVIEAYEVVD